MPQFNGPLAGNLTVTECRLIAADELGKATEFLRSQGYSRSIAPEDLFFVSEIAGEILGCVRLSREDGVLVLRGMRVRSDVQRRGIGTQLLNRLVLAARSEACFCIPYRWLISFYVHAGFREVTTKEVPAFLAERRAAYANSGLDVVLMLRPPD